MSKSSYYIPGIAAPIVPIHRLPSILPQEHTLKRQVETT
jgi:hypothetical protein